MEALYISDLSSKRLIGELYNSSKRNPGFAIQKFNYLFAHGLIENGVKVSVLSSPPVSRRLSKKVFWKVARENENGIDFNYLFFINLPVIRQICLFISAFLKTLFWLSRKKERKIIICDVLKTSICAATLLASKIFKSQTVGFVTDMPGLMVKSDVAHKQPWKTKISTAIIKRYISSFDKYIFMTEAANKVINVHKRPYIIMEGFSDPSMASLEKPHVKNDKRVIMYAGGLFARYGLETLVKAVIEQDPDKCEFRLYGSGAFVEELENYYCKNYSNIKYMGVALNSDVIKAELEADLLVNPRPTHEEFTQYSFPSKNIEYMSTGTPLVTTKLPGMPQEYYPFVYLLEDETVEGYASTINSLLQLSDEDLLEKGKKAKDFVLSQKNNVEQGRRIFDLLMI